MLLGFGKICTGPQKIREIIYPLNKNRGFYPPPYEEKNEGSFINKIRRNRPAG